MAPEAKRHSTHSCASGGCGVGAAPPAADETIEPLTIGSFTCDMNAPQADTHKIVRLALWNPGVTSAKWGTSHGQRAKMLDNVVRLGGGDVHSVVLCGCGPHEDGVEGLAGEILNAGARGSGAAPPAPAAFPDLGHSVAHHEKSYVTYTSKGSNWSDDTNSNRQDAVVTETSWHSLFDAEAIANMPQGQKRLSWRGAMLVDYGITGHIACPLF